MSLIAVVVEGEVVRAFTPYHKDFHPAAKRLGGRFSKDVLYKGYKLPCWAFDARYEPQVRELCRKIYGTDDSSVPGTCTVRLTLLGGVLKRDDSGHVVERYGDGTCGESELEFAGRSVARSPWRDKYFLGDGVAILEGAILAQGSRRSPTIGWKHGTVLEVVKLYESKVEEEIQAWLEAKAKDRHQFDLEVMDS